MCTQHTLCLFVFHSLTCLRVYIVSITKRLFNCQSHSLQNILRLIWCFLKVFSILKISQCKTSFKYLIVSWLACHSPLHAHICIPTCLLTRLSQSDDVSQCFRATVISLFYVTQDGRADVVANDAGDRVTPAVVGYRDDEQVHWRTFFRASPGLLLDWFVAHLCTVFLTLSLTYFSWFSRL